MRHESEPITDDEWLFRRVHHDRFRSDRVPFVSPDAFEPRVGGREPNVDGISLFRADCLESTDDLLNLIKDPEKRSKIGVVAVTAREVRELGLTIQSTPRQGISGHVSLAEMSAAAMKTSEGKAKCKKWMLALATLASPKDRIIRPPLERT